MFFRKLTGIIALFALLMGVVVSFVTQPLSGKELSGPPPVDPAKLESHVKYLSVDLYPRSYEQARNINRAASYIQDQLTAVCENVTIQEYAVQDIAYKNVIARFGPASGPMIVIGAHYDSDGDANAGARYPEGYSPATHTPGADDNASGVAGLIELARLLQKNPPNRPVELVAYTLEEMPFFRTKHMGSMQHATLLAEQGREVALMLSLEMIGYFSDKPGSQEYPVSGMRMLYPDTGNFIALVGRFEDFSIMRRVKATMAGATDLPVFSINAPILVQGIDFSDHRSYWAKDYPALMVTDTAFYRNPYYHDAEDTYEKLDYKRMAKVVESVYSVVQSY